MSRGNSGLEERTTSVIIEGVCAQVQAPYV